MVGNQPTALRITVPQGPTRPRQALPIGRSFADHVVRISEQRANEQGKEISCKKGCGACCRQMVPISPSEAHALADLVESMPPERRERVKARFQQAVERLEPSGVFKPFRKQWPGRHRRPGKPAPAELDGDKLRQIGLNYTRQWVACPFLEEESCSIYEDRPLACREYSVTSPAELCSDPKPGVIQTLPLVAHPARAWWAVEAEQHAQAEQRPPRWLPLTLALEWAKTYSEAPAQSPGPALATSFFSKLSNRDDLDAAPAPGMGSSASEPTDRVSR
jgi:Fe-S-cluster containining protein